MKKLLLTLSIACCLTANAQYTKLLDFNGPNGTSPYGSLFYDGTFLYGTTKWGGVKDSGTIFKIKPDGTAYTKLYDFHGQDGGIPVAALISDGTFLYGTTYNGGTYNVGTVFKIMPDGSNFTKLLDFNGPNGSSPAGSLFYDGTFLYGMASGNGTNYSMAQIGNNGYGLIFRLKTDGTRDTVLYQFPNDASNGRNALGGLISDGTFLYGMAQHGGSGPCGDGCGTVFKLMPDGTAFTKLMDFVATNGEIPNGNLLLIGNYLYGLTSDGGTAHGTVFTVKTDGTNNAVLFNFTTGPALGAYPLGNLFYDGTYLYGTTIDGGANYVGSIFKIKPDGTGYTTLFDNFVQTNGNQPIGGFVSDGTCLYGIAGAGGTKDSGAVYKYCLTNNGINQYNNSENISIYPNPAQNNFTVEVSNTEKQTLSIFDVTGKQVLTQTITGVITIDASSLENGLYFIQLKNSSGIRTQKIMAHH